LANKAALESAHSWQNAKQEREWNYGLEPTIGLEKNPNGGCAIMAGEFDLGSQLTQYGALKLMQTTLISFRKIISPILR
jgi:hypothetical protein